MPEPETSASAPAADAFSWRTVHGVLVVLVLAVFLFSLREILNPFLIFLLLLFLVSPQAGTRYHVLLVSATAVLTLVWLLETTGFLLAPFLLALVLAYVLHPLVSMIERLPRVSRSLAVFLLTLPLLLAITLLVLWGIPALAREVAGFIETIPALIRTGVEWLERRQADLVRLDVRYLDEDVLLERVRAIRPEAVVAWLQERQAEMAQRAWRGILGVGRGVGSVLTIVSYVFLTPILVFYLLRDWKRITTSLAELVPPGERGRVLGFFREYDRLLAAYLRGQLLAAALVGLFTWLGLRILDFPNALLIGVVAGVFNVVPYLGLVVSLLPAVVIALFSGDPLLAFGKIALVFTAVQILDGSVIGPKIVGEAVELHPVWVILALAVAGYFFGFVGLLIAVPLAVLVKLLVTSALARYRGSRLFQGEPVLATAPALDPAPGERAEP